MLVAFPAAYLFGSACVDRFARATGRRRWFRTASHLNALGIASALAAAIPGLIDHMFVVPPKSSAKNPATDHMFANLSALAMFAFARAGRREEDQPAAPWAMAAEVAGVGLLTTGGWLGGTLVYAIRSASTIGMRTPANGASKRSARRRRRSMQPRSPNSTSIR